MWLRNTCCRRINGKKNGKSRMLKRFELKDHPQLLLMIGKSAAGGVHAGLEKPHIKWRLKPRSCYWTEKVKILQLPLDWEGEDLAETGVACGEAIGWCCIRCWTELCCPCRRWRCCCSHWGLSCCKRSKFVVASGSSLLLLQTAGVGDQTKLLFSAWSGSLVVSWNFCWCSSRPQRWCKGEEVLCATVRYFAIEKLLDVTGRGYCWLQWLEV
jgi:hypothetical protein